MTDINQEVQENNATPEQAAPAKPRTPRAPSVSFLRMTLEAVQAHIAAGNTAKVKAAAAAMRKAVKIEVANTLDYALGLRATELINLEALKAAYDADQEAGKVLRKATTEAALEAAVQAQLRAQEHQAALTEQLAAFV
jgi:hypothetical protein